MEINKKMNNLDKSQFITIGKNLEKMESITRPNLTYWKDAWRRLKKNKIARIRLLL